MTVTTIDATSGGVNYVLSRYFAYLAARTGPGAGSTMFTGGDYKILQWYFPSQGNYFIQEVYLAFDTSGIPDTDDITSIVLQMNVTGGFTSVGWDVDVRAVPWGPTVSTADWVPGESLTSYTLVASKAATSTTGWMSFTSETAFLSVAGLKTGTIYLHLTSSRTRDGNAPSTGGTEESITWANVAPDLPKLVVTHVPAVVPVEEVTASLPVQIGAGGELTDVAPVESVTTTLGVSVGASAELTDVGLIEDLTTSLALNLTLDGELTSAPLEVEAVTASLPLTVDLGGTLAVAPLGVPRVTSGVLLTVSAGGVLSSVTESVQSAQVALVVVIDGSGVLAHPPTFSPPRPQGRRATRPYVRTSTSRVYKSQSQSRRF